MHTLIPFIQYGVHTWNVYGSHINLSDYIDTSIHCNGVLVNRTVFTVCRWSPNVPLSPCWLSQVYSLLEQSSIEKVKTRRGAKRKVESFRHHPFKNKNCICGTFIWRSVQIHHSWLSAWLLRQCIVGKWYFVLPPTDAAALKRRFPVISQTDQSESARAVMSRWTILRLPCDEEPASTAFLIVVSGYPARGIRGPDCDSVAMAIKLHVCSFYKVK